jgi:tryptophanyl-tRNA synthetase
MVHALEPIRTETERLLGDVPALDALLRDGAARAAAIAEPILKQVQQIVGFLD